MKVLFLASEMAPYVKTGGLADVLASLPAAIQDLGHDVRVVLPRYRTIDVPLEYVADYGVPLGFETETAVVKKDPAAALATYFIENYRFFDREGVYGDVAGDFGDNGARYGFFCRAALQLVDVLDWIPDILHLNDWQTGLAATFLRTSFTGQGRLSQTRCLFTIHNIAYQGNYPREVLDYLGLGQHLYHQDVLEFHGNVSFLKAGLVFSDAITTVSPTYAREIQTLDYGCGMHGVLKSRSKVLAGVLNGADDKVWNPRTDPQLYGMNYTPRSLGRKSKIKEKVLSDLQISYDPAVPLFGMVGRLVDQKGLDILSPILEDILEWPIQLVILGKGHERYQRRLLQVARQYPEKAATLIRFDETWAHRIEAASDFFLMPSLYEPCGLNQMYSLRYGTIPIVRQTGGLADTVFDCRTDPMKGNGLVFSDYTSYAFRGTMAAAVELYKDRKALDRIRRRGMQAKFTWKQSAEEYVKLYKLARSM